jgi:pyridinium-3,5-biscarboxylic acid mononucleotide sulfurtransferase
MDWQNKLNALKQKIAEKNRLLVALSGGVDSGLLSKISTDILGDQALCVILDHEAFARRDLRQAMQMAESLGLNYRVTKFSMLNDPEVLKNSPQRCYFCRKGSAKVLKSMALDETIECIADGLNLTDFEDYRPGVRAYDEAGVWHPFVETGISKKDIREISKELGLSFWNKPTSSCLATRIQYNDLLSDEKLRMVENSEDYLIGLGFSEVRIRAHGKLSRIELSHRDLASALRHKEEICMALKNLGFQYITLDLEGFRSGSMNEVLWTSLP